ncbi:MAG: extracellular solute-binding protein [Spirochaetales bacterium]
MKLFFVLASLVLVGPLSSQTLEGLKISTTSGLTVKQTNGPNENQPWELERFEALKAGFAKLATNVTVKASDTMFDRQMYAVRLAANTMEDAFLVAFTEPKFLIEKKYVADITSYVNKWKHFAEFNPDVLGVVSDDQGKVFGLPVNGYSLGLMYNRTMFKKAGLDPEKPPKTWDELRAYAEKLTDTKKGIAGFAACSKASQGGWHFTAMVYSFGGDLEKQVNGKWVADFSNPKSLAALEFLRALRWDDETMTKQQMLEDKDLLQLLASGRIAMAIMAGDKLRNLKEQYQVDMNEFGLGPLPQGGGNATLAGGAAWMFNPKTPPAVLEAAVAWTIFHSFINYDSDIKGQSQRGQLVGWPRLPVFSGPYETERGAIEAKYANAPIKNYVTFVNAKNIKVRAEPPVESKKLYTALDSVLQAVLTNPLADPKQELVTAERQFQKSVLDTLK